MTFEFEVELPCWQFEGRSKKFFICISYSLAQYIVLFLVSFHCFLSEGSD